jgi:sugar phosphate isomerase/epimerase
MFDIQFAAAVGYQNEWKRLELILETISLAGYAGVELDSRNVVTREEVERVREMCYKHQIAPSGGWLNIGVKDTDTFTSQVTQLAEALDYLGAEYLIINIETSRGEEEWISRLEAAADICKDSNLVLTALTQTLASEKDSNMLRYKLGEIEIGMAIDVGQRIESGITVHELIRKWPTCNHLRVPCVTFKEDMLNDLSGELSNVGFTGWAVADPSHEGDITRLAAIRDALQRELE